MLMMAPERCRRIIGSTCLHAMIVPRRLIAQTWSKASSVSSSSGLSPPAMLTPTLLCRISRRHRARAAFTAAASVCSFFTSAAKGTHSPPSFAGHRDGLLRGGDKPVNGQNPGVFLRKAERRRAAIPHPLTGALAGPNDCGDLAFETHGRAPIDTRQ